MSSKIAIIKCRQREPGALWIPSQHKNSRSGFSPKWLIIHGTAGGSSAEAIGNWFQNPDSQAATHYVVGQDGKVVQCVDESEAAWGNGRVEAGADPCTIYKLDSFNL
jgi:N-acetyl-anhydromuramyl-L-alanine amidase AmpD